MQLKSTFIAALLMITGFLFAQDVSEDPKKEKKLPDGIDVSFMTSYYQQDGNHSPVTGGVGTEYLTNIAPSVIVNIPIDSVHTLSVNAAVDVYSSASSDNINNPFLVDNHISSASARDARKYINFTYKNKSYKKHTSWGAHFGVSAEYDVASLSAGMSFSKTSKDNNREINVKGMYYADAWKLIYPVELRNRGIDYLNKSVRHSANFSLTGSTIINKRLTAALTTDLVIQSGLLSTPFHRVYFEGADEAVVEQLPDFRVKVPVGGRLNYYITDWLIMKTYYRIYWDSWDIIGNTVRVELPITINKAFRVYPFYRFHTQTAAKYFANYKVHTGTEEFYTSDFDLSGLQSHKFGLGVNIAPLYGIFRMKALGKKDKVNIFESVDLRYAHYIRSDGLTADLWSVALNFKLRK